MKRFFRGIEGILCVVLAVVLLAGLLGTGYIVYQLDCPHSGM